MAPVPAIPAVPEAGQTLLSFDNVQIRANRPRVLPLLVHKVLAKLTRQWFFGSQYENQLVWQFRTACLMALGLAEDGPEDVVQHQHSYSCELKLAAIE